MKRHDQISSLVYLFFAAWVGVESFRLTLGTFHFPGPGFFPFGISCILALLSIILYVRTQRLRNTASEPSWYSREKWKDLMLVLALLLAYAFFLEILGFLISTFLLIFFLFRVIEPKSWTVAAGAGLLTSLSSYALFEWWLQARLPKGYWGF